MFKIYDEPVLQIVVCVFCVSCSRVVMLSPVIVKRGGMKKPDDDSESPNEGGGGGVQIYDREESPNEGACCRYMTTQNRKRGERLRYQSPNEAACLGHRMDWNRQRRGHAYGK